jgi:transcriptional regulator with XRE-family HTH domain
MDRLSSAMRKKFAHSEPAGKHFVRYQRHDRLAASSHDANMAEGSASFPANLRAARKARGWSMDQLAAAAETSKGYVSDLERGVRPIPPGRTVERLAGALGIGVDDLLGAQPSEPLGVAERQAPFRHSAPGDPVNLADLRAYITETQNQPKPILGRGKVVERKIPVVGEVAAGVWKAAPVRELHSIEEWLSIEVDGYERAQLRAWKLVGPSMNLVYPPGRYVVTAHPTEAGLRIGDYVIVQRMRAGLAEVTCKEFLVDEQGRMLLMPRSSDPEFQEPIYLKSADELDQSSPEIVGVVVADYGKRNRPTAPFGRSPTWAE